MGALVHEHGVAFRVWAPNAESLSVTGDFNDWDDEATPLEREGGGYWYGNVTGAAAGEGYILHRMWRDEAEFRFGKEQGADVALAAA